LSEPKNASSSGYNKAFQNFVPEPDDVVGLLAYALYKRTINEQKISGRVAAPPDQRDPQRHEIDVHRTKAEDYLKVFAQTAIDAERADILADGIKDAAEDIKASVMNSANDVKLTVRARTGFWWPGVVVGIVAWIISIIATIVVVYSAPEWVKSLVEHIGSK